MDVCIGIIQINISPKLSVTEDIALSQVIKYLLYVIQLKVISIFKACDNL